MRTGYKNNRVGRRYWLLVVLSLLVASGTAGVAGEGAGDAIAPAPGSADLLVGVRTAIQRGDWEQALELANEALHSGATKVPVLLLQAQIYAGVGNVEKQRQALELAVALDNSLCEPRLVLARLEENRGLWQRAGELYQQAIDADANCRAAYLRLADLYENNAQPHQALKVLQQAVNNNPNDTFLLAALADMYKRRHLLPQGEAVYAQIIKVGDDAVKAAAYGGLGEIYMQVEQYADAFECYVKAAQLQGEPTSVHTAGSEQIFGAADKAVADTLEQAWKSFTAHVQGGPVAREEAYVAVRAAAEQIYQIKQFAAQIKAPPAFQPVHNQRQLFYSVAYEAAFTAQVYLDTGNKRLRDAAGQRRYQADRERKVLATLSSP